MEDDVLNTMSLIEDVSVNIFYRNINASYSIIYIRFNYGNTIAYLRRFLDNDIIENVLNNIILSVNTVNTDGKILKQLISIDQNSFISKYTDTTNIVYMYKYISKNKIINMNGVYDKKAIDGIKSISNVSVANNVLNGYYVPTDTVIINNTTKTN
jgi:hypothetical protein